MMLWSISSQVYYYFGCSSGNTVLAWVSALILLSLGVLYIVLHYCAGSGYGKNLKEQLSWSFMKDDCFVYQIIAINLSFYHFAVSALPLK